MAVTIQETQQDIKQQNTHEIGNKIDEIQYEVAQTDLADDDQRQQLRRALKDRDGEEVTFDYWSSQECVNLTVRSTDYEFYLPCMD